MGSSPYARCVLFWWLYCIPLPWLKISICFSLQVSLVSAIFFSFWVSYSSALFARVGSCNEIIPQ